MADVARLAGVSVITVSRVLREPGRVAESTRSRVLSAVDEIGYVPNLVARSLRSHRSGFVAAIIPSVTHSIVADVMHGMMEVLREQGLHLLLADSGFSPEEEEELVAAFLARRPEAIYLTGATHTATTRRLLGAAGVPVVESGNLTNSPIDMVVGFSNSAGARAITEAMIARGRRVIGYVGQSGMETNERVRDRREGYRSALREHGLRDDQALWAEADLSYVGGGRAMAALVERSPEIDAVFCSSDILALGALYECQRRGWAVPGRIAIAGFDDQEISSQCVPSLSTVRVPRREMGRRAGRLICRRLAGLPIETKVVDVGFELVLRETT